jgi:HTH-type transcriptional regulator / antitoxin HipB
MTTTQPDREGIAARWLIEQDDPAFSDRQREQLARWLMESFENLQAYLELVSAWRWTLVLYRDEAPVVYEKRRKSGDAAATSSTTRSLIDRRFGSVLRVLREARGFSQSELAMRAGMRVGEIDRLEAGTRSLTLPTTYVLAGALGVSASRLVSELEPAFRGKKPAREKKKAPRPRKGP